MIDAGILRDAYGHVAFARQLDTKVHVLSRSGAALVMWFPWRGTELVAAAIGLSLRRDDYLVSYYRDSASQLAKGFSPRAMIAEVLGKATGSQKGKSGFVHTIDLAANVVMNSGVVGAQLPIAAGWALSSVIRADGKVTICTFGDGAANEGAFHEAMTLASLWNLPIVYVCYNNSYGEHTAFRVTSPVEHVSDRATAYSVPAVTVDGGDFAATWDVLNAAIERARSGAGPTLVEAMVRRPWGHHHFDNMAYVPKAELAAEQADDPLDRFRAWLITEGHATAGELAELDEQAGREVEQAWEWAAGSPDPDPGELYTDVYATN